MAEDAPALLASHAAKLSRAIYTALEGGRLRPSDLDGYRSAHDVAVRLHLINTYLESLPPYWIEFDVEQLCSTMLRDLQAITRPWKRSTSSISLPSVSYFSTLFGHGDSPDPETCLVTFFKVQRDNAQKLKGICDDLLGKLTRDEGDVARLSDCAIQFLDVSDAVPDFSHSLFSAVQLVAECDSELHDATGTAPVPAGKSDSRALWHPARLCLHEVTNDQDLTSHNVGLLVSAMDMTYWQEFCLSIQPGSHGNDKQKLLGRGDFCRILEKEITARLFLSFKYEHGIFLLEKSRVLKQIFQTGLGEPLKSVLRNYDLTPKDKVMLSYAIARSYWQYYDSDLMRIKWTSDTIWFMPEKDSRGHDSQLALCAYLSFPFEVPSNDTPEILYEELLNHQCPRIFDIGVLLLEIGLGKPFRTGNRRNVVAQANLDHKIATDELLDLETTNWDGFTNKKYFDKAVKFCLNGENFVPPRHPKTTQAVVVFPTGPTAASDCQAGVLMRKRIFHKNVVRPLAWLAKKGFRAKAGDFTYANRKPTPSSHTGLFNMPWRHEPEALFHSAIIPTMWLRDLKKISEQVERKRRECRITTSVRVAILDTGLNRDLPVSNARSRMIESVKEEADFVKPGTPTMTDTFGHGTLMARLVMECAPGVEILVARVAENTNELKNSQENIRQSFLHRLSSGLGKPAKPTSFPCHSDDDQGIREAIDTVQRKRNEDIIFLASAGNSSTDDESFPARHASVISVYATDCRGTFLRSNSASTSNGAAVLGACGDDIPDYIREEFNTTYPNVCKPGSSVATAIMAGISATMLAYAPVLPSLVPLQGVAASTSNHVLRRLWTAKGMEAMLFRLAREDEDHPRLRAVNPMWFWKSRPNDAIRYCAICDTLSDIDRRYPRMTGMG